MEVGVQADFQTWPPDSVFDGIRMPILINYESKISFYFKFDDGKICEWT